MQWMKQLDRCFPNNPRNQSCRQAACRTAEHGYLIALPASPFKRFKDVSSPK